MSNPTFWSVVPSEPGPGPSLWLVWMPWDWQPPLSHMPWEREFFKQTAVLLLEVRAGRPSSQKPHEPNTGRLTGRRLHETECGCPVGHLHSIPQAILASVTYILGTEMMSLSCSYASFSPPNVYLAWMTSIDCIEHECGIFFPKVLVAQSCPTLRPHGR